AYVRWMKIIPDGVLTPARKLAGKHDDDAATVAIPTPVAKVELWPDDHRPVGIVPLVDWAALPEGTLLFTTPSAIAPAPSVEEVFEHFANRGYSPALVFDDDGRWAISDMGSSPVPDSENGHTETVGITSIVQPEQWKPTIREALDAFLADNPMLVCPKGCS